MSNLSYSEYLERFSVVSQTQVRQGVETGLYQDSTDKTIYNVVIYTSIDKKTRDEIMEEFFRSYIPEHSLRLVYFTGKKPQTGADSESEERNLILIFEPSKTLADYLLYSPDTEFISPEPRQPSESPRFASTQKTQVQTLTIKEVSNLFSCLVNYLAELHARYLFHGDIREATLQVTQPLLPPSGGSKHDPNNKLQPAVKGQLYPGMLSKAEAVEIGHSGLFVLPEEAELKAAGITRAVAAARMGVPPGQARMFELFAEQQADIYNLALLVARLINPALFFAAIMPHPQYGKRNGIADGSRMLKVGDSLVGVLGYPLGPIILECLDSKPEARPTSQEIQRRLKDVKLENSVNLEESALSLRKWELQEDQKVNSPATEGLEGLGVQNDAEPAPDIGSQSGRKAEANLRESLEGVEKAKQYVTGFQSLIKPINRQASNLLSPDRLQIPMRALYGTSNEDNRQVNHKSPRLNSDNFSQDVGFATLKNMLTSHSDPSKQLKTMFGSNMRGSFDLRGTKSDNGVFSNKFYQTNMDSNFMKVVSPSARMSSNINSKASPATRFEFRPSSPVALPTRAKTTSFAFQQRLACLAKLESEVWSQIESVGPVLKQTLGEIHYDLKQLPCAQAQNGFSREQSHHCADIGSSSPLRTLGYIQYPNNDVYFGWISQLAKDDLGLLFLASGNVYHGQFRRGRISGRGVYLFADGETYTGHWLDDELHGKGTLKTVEGRVFACRFERGALVDKIEQDEMSVDWEQAGPSSSLLEFYQKGFLRVQIIQELLSEYILPRSMARNQDLEESQQSGRIASRSTSLKAKGHFTMKKPLPVDRFVIQKPEFQEDLQASENAQLFYKGYYRDLLAKSPEPKQTDPTEKRLSHYLHEEYAKDERQSQNIVLGQLQKIYGKLQKLEMGVQNVAPPKPERFQHGEQRYWEGMGSMLKNSGRPQDMLLSPYRHKRDPEHLEYDKRQHNFRISELANEASSCLESPAQSPLSHHKSSKPTLKVRQVRLQEDQRSHSSSRIAQMRPNHDLSEKGNKETQRTPRTGRRRDVEGVSEHAGYNQELRIVMTVKPELSPDIKRSVSKNPNKQEQGRLANILDDLDSELDEEHRRRQRDPSNKPPRSRSQLQRPVERLDPAALQTEQLKKKVITVTGSTDGSPQHAGFEMPRAFGSFNSANLPGGVYDRNHTGFAQVFFDQGERFYGNFIHGLAEGRGAYYSRDGWIVQGLWKKGRLDQLLDSPFSKQTHA